VEQLQTAYNGLLKLVPPDLVADDTPFGFELNEQQKVGRDMIRMLIERNDNKCGIMLGKGGTGKTATIKAAKDLLVDIVGPSGFTYFAPTGKAASHLPQGCTCHSHRSGLGFPTKGPFVAFNGTSLKRAQERYRNTKVVVVDEFSMLKQKEVLYLHRQLQAITGIHNRPFGGLIVLFLGDPTQLPPVGGRVVWDGTAAKDKDDRKGYELYLSNFTNVVELTENRRLNRSDPEADYFGGLQDRIGEGNITLDDYERLKLQSIGTLGKEAFEEKFNPAHHNVTSLFCTNNLVNKYNGERLKELGSNIVLIQADHTGTKAHHMSDDHFNGLKTSLMLAIGAKVYCTTNACTHHGLVNGVSGTVISIVYDEGKHPPDLPRCVVVDCGNRYNGPAFFDGDERRGWVPIHPMTATAHWPGPNGVAQEKTRTMLPLGLAWAWTIWKSQGMTIDHKLVINLGPKEAEHRLTYVTFSRAWRLRDIGILGAFTHVRMIENIRNHAKMKTRKTEEA
jgi:ATP-dependent exoDNAse (exonuclease V) alpha subunit